MMTRLKRGGYRSRYRMRKYTVEPVFGHTKAARGFRQFLLRGPLQRKATHEWQLTAAAHNLLKLAGVVSSTAQSPRGLVCLSTRSPEPVLQRHRRIRRPSRHTHHFRTDHHLLQQRPAPISSPLYSIGALSRVAQTASWRRGGGGVMEAANGRGSRSSACVDPVGRLTA